MTESLYKNLKAYGLLEEYHTPFKFFKGCLPQILPSPFLNTLFQRLLQWLIFYTDFSKHKLIAIFNLSKGTCFFYCSSLAAAIGRQRDSVGGPSHFLTIQGGWCKISKIYWPCRITIKFIYIPPNLHEKDIRFS